MRLEIDAAAVQNPARFTRYQEPPVHQPIMRNLAFALPHRVSAGEIVSALHAAGPDWLDAIAITDRFDFTEEGTALRAITFELKFTNEGGERSSDEVNQHLIGL